MQRPLLIILTLLASWQVAPPGAALNLPWREAGLSQQEAAAHLLDRFTYGPRPGEVDRVVEVGLEEWFEAQLRGTAPEPELAAKLRDLTALRLSNREIAATYPNPGLVLREAQRDGVFSMEEDPRATEDPAARQEMRRTIVAYAREQGYRPQRELVAALMTQKLYRAVYGENQLVDVLTDFWFNHFNVSITDNQARPYVVSYERDAIRPHVLGNFRDMLGATAAHPAMLLYLDNAQSGAPEGQRTTVEQRMARQPRAGGRGRGGRPRGGQNRPRGPQGLNENYARELLELHTLGVDGGYTQGDVIEVARAFTGWTVFPPGSMGEMAHQRLRQVEARGELGFVVREGFLFRADLHDAEKKEVLGVHLPAGRGIEDGEEVLDLVARHPSTASHLARKIAVRFVADEPPASLVERLEASFRQTRGDLQAMIRTLVESPEFWDPTVRRQKIKSPFEVAASALRGLDAEVEAPRPIVEWVSRMGQPLYAYQAPTGFPDRAEAWVNTGSLLNRMNFGLQLATGRVRGVAFDLLALNDHREPESVERALATYAALLMPQRDLTETLRLLEPVVRDPELASKVEGAAPGAAADPLAELENWPFPGDSGAPEAGRRFHHQQEAGRYSAPTPLAHVVGVILGSPEFQRR